MKKIITTIFIITIVGFSLNVFAQSKTVNNKKSKKTTKVSKKKQEPKLISAGVVNGRALNLVKPDYLESARAIHLSGTVEVEIIIDEAGYVLEAKVLSGHKLLRNSAIEAAKNSKFAPYFVDDIQVKVSGIIIYSFLQNKLNWLEIGYHSVETERIISSLPDNFSAEKDLIHKMNSTETPYDPNGFKNLVSSIENKLRTDEKKLWLFQLGMTLRNLIDNQWDTEAKINSVTEIQTLLYIKPKNASPNLISKLENLVKTNQENPDSVKDSFIEIFDNFYILGK